MAFLSETRVLRELETELDTDTDEDDSSGALVGRLSRLLVLAKNECVFNVCSLFVYFYF